MSNSLADPFLHHEAPTKNWEAYWEALHSNHSVPVREELQDKRRVVQKYKPLFLEERFPGRLIARTRPVRQIQNFGCGVEGKSHLKTLIDSLGRKMWWLVVEGHVHNIVGLSNEGYWLKCIGSRPPDCSFWACLDFRQVLELAPWAILQGRHFQITYACDGRISRNPLLHPFPRCVEFVLNPYTARQRQ